MPATTPQFNDRPGSAGDMSAGTEHLTHLPKMSPTAGVATQEYVAINLAAVASLLLGMASILAFIYEALFVIALAGFGAALLALRQIGHSNGTQAGRGIAMTGLFLATSIGSFVGASDTFGRLARAADCAAISHDCELLGQDMRDRTFDAAYDLFSMRFKSQVSRLEFVATLKGNQDSLARSASTGGLGPVISAEWSGVAQFVVDTDAGTYTANTEIIFDYTHIGSEVPLSAVFRKAGNAWTIDSIPSLFPPKKARSSAGTSP